jgi:tripartite-type tricarboxylate transporter receptor subunit TctC
VQKACFIAAMLATLAGSAVLTGSATAQTFPSKPITIVVPFAAGGPVDTTTRIMAERMKSSLGQSIVVENVTGAAGSIAAGRVARAAPDGYTLATGIWGTHVANGAIYSLQYDVQKDFEPVALLCVNPLLIVAKKDMPAKNLTELVGWLKANPDKASQGTSGVGSVGHIAGAFFQSVTGTRFAFVPYRGLGPAMQDLLAGTIDLMFDTPTTSLPHVKSGGLRAYAVTAKTRLPAAPDIPTVDEAGLPGMYASTWTAFFAPKGTPKEAVDKLNAAAKEALADPAVRKRLAEIGQEIYPVEQQSPEALAAFQQAEIAKWWPIIKAANIKGE